MGILESVSKGWVSRWRALSSDGNVGDLGSLWRGRMGQH